MSDLISRQAAIDAIERNAYRHTYIDQIVRIINDLPTVQERKKGRWIHYYEGDFDYDYKCSNCGYAVWDDSDFCPNCGAKMEGKVEK